jgi:hypothetical protein
MIPDAAVEALAGNNPDALALLEGAYEQLSGPDLERLLLAHASPAVFGVGMPEALFLVMQLDDAVERWRVWQRDQAEFVCRYGADWTADQVDAEVLAPLFCLLNGRHPCRACLQGRLFHVGALGVEGDCRRHGPARQVRHELLQRVLGGAA